MKKLLLATTLLGAFALSSQALAAEKWEFDAGHATILFEYNHLGFSTTYGVFRTFTGELMLDQDSPENSSVTAEIPLSSLDTFSEARDNHLMSGDFFEADVNPVITFTSTSVANVDGNTAQVTGDLSIHGTTLPVTLDVVMNKIAEHPMAKKPWTGFNASTTLKRSDYGLDKFTPWVGDEVKITISVEAMKAE
jgi:polyisoprenoid-binding protein YceI